MTLQTIKLADHISLEALFDHCEKRRAAAPKYTAVCNRRILDAYNAARKANLRFHRKTNILRDNAIGILSQPVTPSEWPEATRDEARETLMDEVWCQAVSAFNREQMGVGTTIVRLNQLTDVEIEARLPSQQRDQVSNGRRKTARVG